MIPEKFTTQKEFRERFGVSEVTQYRDRYPRGPLEYYRKAGEIVYTEEQIENYFEAKRVGADKPDRSARAVAA